MKLESGVGSYWFGFNGKERDTEFQNNYDYGFRIYNPGLAKFLSVDPLTSSYPWYTPYQFAGNTPIEAIDVDGLEPATINRGNNGQFLGISSAGDNLRMPQSQPILSKQSEASIPVRQQAQVRAIEFGENFLPHEKAMQLGADVGELAVAAYKLAVVGPKMLKLLKSGKAYTSLGSAAFNGLDNLKGIKIEFHTYGLYSGIPIPKITLKGAGKVSTCVEYAQDFMLRAAPAMADEGASVRHLIFIGDGNVIKFAGKDIAYAGPHVSGETRPFHEFIEVTKEGKKYIFDNINHKGMDASEWWKKLDGLRKENFDDTGASLEKYVQVKAIK